MRSDDGTTSPTSTVPHSGAPRSDTNVHFNREQANLQGASERSGRAAATALKVLGPAMLVAGVLVLVVYHFNSLLAGYQLQQAQGNGVMGFSAGHLAVQLHRDGAGGRPAILYNGQTVISYDDAQSTIVVDGQRQELWNGDHGYSQDVGKRELFSTASGANWQVVQITQLVNDHSVTVAYYLAVHGTQVSTLHQVVVQVTHEQHVWSEPQVSGNSFSAIALPPPPPALANALVQPIGSVHVQASGTYLVSGSLIANTQQGSSGQAGATMPWATTFTTTYEVDQPLAQTLIPLGTETITFDPSSNAAPVVFPAGG
jgi:hypothetical protein